MERVLGGTMGLQQQGGRLAGALQGGAIDRLEGHIREGIAGAAGLLDAFLGQRGEIVTALNPAFLVETAQAMANEQDPEGHGSCAAGIPSYGSGFVGPAARVRPFHAGKAAPGREGRPSTLEPSVQAGNRGESPHLPP